MDFGNKTLSVVWKQQSKEGVVLWSITMPIKNFLSLVQNTHFQPLLLLRYEPKLPWTQIPSSYNQHIVKLQLPYLLPINQHIFKLQAPFLLPIIQLHDIKLPSVWNDTTSAKPDPAA